MDDPIKEAGTNKAGKKIKIVLFSLLGISVIIYMAVFFYRSTIELSNNPITIDKRAPVDYINLFNLMAQKNLVLQSATSFKLRNTIARLTYNNTYDIELTKIMVKSNFQIRTDIIETYNKAGGVSPQPYISYNGNDLITNYNGNSKNTTSKIYLSLYGDSTQTYIKNDSVAYYNSALKSAHIQYVPEGIYEISIDAQKKFYFFQAVKSVTIMFQKRKNYLYFILLRDKVSHTKLDPYLLYKLTHID